jgi:hypothetical protein
MLPVLLFWPHQMRLQQVVLIILKEPLLVVVHQRSCPSLLQLLLCRLLLLQIQPQFAHQELWISQLWR